MGGSEESRCTLLFVDDDKDYLKATSRILRTEGFEVARCTRSSEAIERLREDGHAFDVAMYDVNMPDIGGIELLERTRELAPGLPVIVVSADDTAGTASQALKLGAFDYYTKPILDYEEFTLVLRRAARHGQLQRRTRELEERVGALDEFGRTIVGRSAAMEAIFGQIGKLADTSVNVLVLGESGTGKELVARAIHDRSERTNKPFVAINCAGLPEGLIDSELFGHEKGAFTGAVSARAGAFERARGGTLFLDEVGDLPPTVQGRMLRVLQEGETRAVGSDVAKKVDVRIIAATLVDLAEAVERKEFRNDLFYRLNVVSMRMPPLRERLDDLPLLVAFFLRKHAPRLGRAGAKLDSDALEALARYRWPGNVRELENAIQRALALTEGDSIGVDALPPEIAGAGGKAATAVAAAAKRAWNLEMPYAEARVRAQRDFERSYLAGMLEATGGNVAAAARRAEMDRSNFRKLLQRTGIDAANYRDDD